MRHLVLGCGDNCNCGKNHPKPEFTTVDISKSVKPDIICDATKVSQMQDKCFPHTYQSVIYEFSFSDACKNSNDLASLSSLIEPAGYFVFPGSYLHRQCRKLDVSQKLWSIAVPASSSEIVILPASDEAKGCFSFIDKYMGANLSKLAKPVLVTEELKARASRLSLLDNLHWEFKDNEYPRMCLLRDTFNAVLLSEPSTQPPTIQSLKRFLPHYDPGFFRRNINGKTKGMLQLVNLIGRLRKEMAEDDPLKTKTLLEFLKIITDRRQRRPDKKQASSTADVMDEIAREILNYFVSVPAVCEELAQLDRENDLYPELGLRSECGMGS